MRWQSVTCVLFCVLLSLFAMDTSVWLTITLSVASISACGCYFLYKRMTGQGVAPDASESNVLLAQSPSNDTTHEEKQGMQDDTSNGSYEEMRRIQEELKVAEAKAQSSAEEAERHQARARRFEEQARKSEERARALEERSQRLDKKLKRLYARSERLQREFEKSVEKNHARLMCATQLFADGVSPQQWNAVLAWHAKGDAVYQSHQAAYEQSMTRSGMLLDVTRELVVDQEDVDAVAVEALEEALACTVTAFESLVDLTSHMQSIGVFCKEEKRYVQEQREEVEALQAVFERLISAAEEQHDVAPSQSNARCTVL